MATIEYLKYNFFVSQYLMPCILEFYMQFIVRLFEWKSDLFANSQILFKFSWKGSVNLLVPKMEMSLCTVSSFLSSVSLQFPLLLSTFRIVFLTFPFPTCICIHFLSISFLPFSISESQSLFFLWISSSSAGKTVLYRFGFFFSPNLGGLPLSFSLIEWLKICLLVIA